MAEKTISSGAAPGQAASRRASGDPSGVRIFGDRLREILIRRAMVILMLIVILAFGLSNDTFFTIGNLQAVLIAAAPFALIAIGETLVILTGGIDLSVGSVIALSSRSARVAMSSMPLSKIGRVALNSFSSSSV